MTIRDRTLAKLNKMFPCHNTLAKACKLHKARWQLGDRQLMTLTSLLSDV
jgi:hypothetical protein